GIVTDADNGLTLTAYVGTTILVDIGGASLPSLNTSGIARAYVQPRSSDIAVLVPIPDPECPDAAATQGLLESAGASQRDAHSLATQVDCGRLIPRGVTRGAFYARAPGDVQIAATGM